MLKLLTILTLFTIINTEAQVFNKSDKLSDFVASIENEMDMIDKTEKELFFQEKTISYLQNYVKKIKTRVYVNRGVVRKLVFDTFDDSYTTNGKEVFYFDKYGKVISHEIRISNLLIHEIYNREIIYVYNKTGKEVSSNSITDKEMVEYIHSSTKYIIDYHLSNFSDLIYTTFDISHNNSPIITTRIKTDIKLLPEYKAKTIKSIPKGSQLIYLDRGLQPEAASLNSKEKWIWIKVKTTDNKIGWIWGHPSIIKQL